MSDTQQHGSAYNPGEIVEMHGWPQWRTRVGPHPLLLDIVAIGRARPDGPELGIASFVVMEQGQPFLRYVADQLAQAILAQVLAPQRLLLVTVESKGSHFAPHVWEALHKVAPERLEERIVTFRKGVPKAYMRRPIVLPDEPDAREPFALAFQSITSMDEQSMVLSPRDTELLHTLLPAAAPVIVDDFLGQGGTIVAVCRYFERLGLQPPRVAGVVGSDGDIYVQTFRDAGLDVCVVPQPFPLRLPVFQRQDADHAWRVAS